MSVNISAYGIANYCIIALSDTSVLFVHDTLMFYSFFRGRSSIEPYFNQTEQCLVENISSRSTCRQLCYTGYDVFFLPRGLQERSGYKVIMSGAEDLSNESVELKEDKQFDVEAEDNLEDDYFDPTRYMFYR